jgi:hypothetical protein
MSKWKNKGGKTVRRETIPKGSQWTWWTIEMIESPAYRVLTLSAHRVIGRIRIEFASHGGKDNGKLTVTFQDFEDYGINRHAIAPAIREAEALGFIRVTQHGRAGNAEWCIPNMFALTHLAVNELNPTNDWNKIETLEEAEAIAKAARKAPKKKQNASIGKRTGPGVGKRTGSGGFPVSENALRSAAKTSPLSIYREGGGVAAEAEGKYEPRVGGSNSKAAGAGAGAGSKPSAGIVELSGLREWSKPVLTEVEYTPALRRPYCDAVSVSPYPSERVQHPAGQKDNVQVTAGGRERKTA